MARVKKKGLNTTRKPERRTSKKTSGPSPMVVIVIFAITSIAMMIGGVIYHEHQHAKIRSVSSQYWNRYSPGGSQLSLLLPGEPQPDSVPASEFIGPNVKQADCYKSYAGEFQVSVRTVVYEDGIPVNTRQAADRLASEIKLSEGVTEYRHTSTQITNSGRPGLLIAGQYNRNGAAMEIEAALLGEGPKLWEVIVTRPRSDRDGRVRSRRVFDSIQIN